MATYKYKMARAVKIGDALYLEETVEQRDPNFPSMQPKKIKLPRVLRVTSIEADPTRVDDLLFFDDVNDLVIKAPLDKRLRIAILPEETQ